MAAVVNVNDVLDGHVALDLECLDRLYLNGYVPCLQVGGQVIRFIKEHLGLPVPSPAVFNKIGTAFRRAVAEFAEVNDVPVVRFKKGDRRIDVMRPYLEAATAPAVVAIGVAQEFQWVFSGYERPTTNPAAVNYGFDKAERRVTCFYFYVVDGEATIVTGGTMVDAKQTSPDQRRGSSIQGGQTYHLTKGDVITIPAKTPHWWKEVPTQTIAYYAVNTEP